MNICKARVPARGKAARPGLCLLSASSANAPVRNKRLALALEEIIMNGISKADKARPSFSR